MKVSSLSEISFRLDIFFIIQTSKHDFIYKYKELYKMNTRNIKIYSILICITKLVHTAHDSHTVELHTGLFDFISRGHESNIDRT